MGKRQIEELQAHQLLVDHTVNRDEPPVAAVTALVKRWRRDATGVLTASRRDDGNYYLIDGQTRRLAALKCDPTFRFVVEVHSGLTTADEIDLFEFINKQRRQVSAIELLRLRVTRGREPYATLGIQLARRGLRLGTASGVSLNVISAAAPLEKLLTYARGARIVGDVLDAVIAAYPKEESRWRGVFLGGVVFTYVAADKAKVPISRARLAKVLQRDLPKHWEMKARATASGVGGSRGGGGIGSTGLATLVGYSIVEWYNKRLSESSRIPTPWIRDFQAVSDDAV